MSLRDDRIASSTHSHVWRCGSDLNRHLLDRQSDALPLSYRSVNGKRLRTAACRMSFARRLLDGKSGRRLHANTPRFCTSALAREARTTCTIRYLSRLTMFVPRAALQRVHAPRIVSPLFPTCRELGRPDLPGVTEHLCSANRIAAVLSRRRRRLAAPGR